MDDEHLVNIGELRKENRELRDTISRLHEKLKEKESMEDPHYDSQPVLYSLPKFLLFSSSNWISQPTHISRKQE